MIAAVVSAIALVAVIFRACFCKAPGDDKLAGGGDQRVTCESNTYGSFTSDVKEDSRPVAMSGSSTRSSPETQNAAALERARRARSKSDGRQLKRTGSFNKLTRSNSFGRVAVRGTPTVKKTPTPTVIIGGEVDVVDHMLARAGSMTPVSRSRTGSRSGSRRPSKDLSESTLNLAYASRLLPRRQQSWTAMLRL